MYNGIDLALAGCAGLHLSLSPVIIQVSWITSSIKSFSGMARVTKQSNRLSFKSRVS